jgi:hypothetical protein
MSPTAHFLEPCGHDTRELTVERRGCRPHHALEVEVRCESLPAADEEKLAREALLQRLAFLRRKMDALRRLHDRGCDGLGCVC